MYLILFECKNGKSFHPKILCVKCQFRINKKMTTEDRLEHTAKDKCSLCCDKEFSNEIIAVYAVPSICFSDHESTNTFATNVACKISINVNMILYTQNKDATCFGAEVPFALCPYYCLLCCNGTTDENDAGNTVHPSEGGVHLWT